MVKLFPMRVEFRRSEDEAGSYPNHVEGLTKGKVYTAIALVKYEDETCFVLPDDNGNFVHVSIESCGIPPDGKLWFDNNSNNILNDNMLKPKINTKRVGYFNDKN